MTVHRLILVHTVTGDWAITTHDLGQPIDTAEYETIDLKQNDEYQAAVALGHFLRAGSPLHP